MVKKVEVSFGTSPERRWQTVAVLFFVSLLPLVAVAYGMALFFVFLPFTTLPMIGYLAWAWHFDKSPSNGERTPILRSWSLWKYFAAYFPVRLVKTADLPAVVCRDPSLPSVF